MERSRTVTHRGRSEPRASLRPSPPSRPNTKPKKAPLHPLAVDYSRPIRPVIPQPPLHLSSLQKSRVPLPPFPENPDPKLSLDDELKGPVDPSIDKELGELMWRQQKRIQSESGGSTDPLLVPIPISVLDIRSSSSSRGVTSAQSRLETIALYGPRPRKNESTCLGEGLTVPNIVALDNDDDDEGFGEVLDLYRGALQGSMLFNELEIVEGEFAGLAEVDWQNTSALEVSIRQTTLGPSSLRDTSGSRIRTLAEYARAIRADGARPSLKEIVPKEEPPLGINWSYSACGYATGTVVNARKISQLQLYRPGPPAPYKVTPKQRSRDVHPEPPRH